MKDITDRISALTPEQRALFEARMKKKGLPQPSPQAETIPRRKDRGSATCPPSIDQERLWFIEQLQPGNTAYNIFTASRIRGSLNVPVMERVINELIQRHEVLRTTFKPVGGLPVQVIAPELKISLSPVDLQHLPEDERYPEALRLTTEDFAAPFDLETGPLVRVGLLRLAADDHVLHVNMHHAITDRWSFAVFEKELAVLYQAFATNRPSPLPELPIQFADYAVWQRARMESETYRTELAYWKQRLAGAPFVLEVPTDFPRPPVQTFRGARVYVEYPRSLLDALKELSRREGVTMFMVLMAAYKALLYRYTGQDDILVSAPIGTRLRPETENLVGYLLNLLIVRTDLSGDPTFLELLSRERESVVGAFAHQELPFGKLVQELKPKQDASRNPVAQVAFLYLDFPETSALEFLGLTAYHIDIDNGASRFDLTLSMTETSEGFIVSIEYLTDLYERDRIERMAKHIQILLEGIVANPDARLSELPLLAPEERRLLLDVWGAPAAREFPATPLAHGLFERQATLRPRAPALLFEDTTLTYGELNRRANRLARHLKALGVGAETRVGVLLERSPDAVVALLAVLKAGGVFLPLDAQYPRERLSFMVNDSNAHLLVTRRALLDDKLPTPAAPLVCLDADRTAIEGRSVEDLHTEVSPRHLAYILYTSGSTGRPKGVLVEHQQLLNTINASLEAFDFKPEDCLPCTAPLSFDISLFELLMPLVSGGRCLLVSSRDVLDAAAASVVLQEATILNAVPALMRQYASVARAGGAAGASSKVRRLLVGGEAIAPELVKELQQAFPSAEVSVLYGPTETAIWCARFDAPRERAGTHNMVGKTIGNGKLRLLDKYGRLVPAGVNGEICVGGAGVARGYLNRPELTAEKFVGDPDSLASGARLYRTGDLGRYLPDGNIAFMGRLDEQVKVRGFRIELGEIEAALEAHEGIRQGVVVAREDASGDRRLVAYVVTADAQSRDVSALRAHLKASLPEYMIPSAFVFLDALPLTPHGKIDRQHLPAPDSQRPELSSAFVAPQTPTEERLASVWSQLLGVSRIGVHDNFFELGGDSLLATQLNSQFRSLFQVELPLRQLFQHPTLRELSTLIEEAIIEQMDQLTDEEAEQLLKE